MLTEADLPSLWNIIEHCQAVLQVCSAFDAEPYRKILSLCCDRIMEIHMNG